MTTTATVQQFITLSGVMARYHALQRHAADIARHLDTIAEQLTILENIINDSSLYRSQGIAQYDTDGTQQTHAIPSNPTHNVAVDHMRTTRDTQSRIDHLKIERAHLQADALDVNRNIASYDVVFNALPSRDRTIIDLRYAERASIATIADTLCISQSDVYYRLRELQQIVCDSLIHE